ncbi:chemerin-like receptor 1 [Hyla sarda]|uniref:chemerin-like receptor 1 n=1 Tax=Hyla sarda TaxID=327740 RepID=UPI0024C292A6|nr:chemerin-like receptor 1 [Hyla sarda]
MGFPQQKQKVFGLQRAKLGHIFCFCHCSNIYNAEEESTHQHQGYWEEPGSNTGKMALSHDLCYSIVDIRLLLKYHESYSSVIWYSSFVMSIVTCLVGLVENAVVICFLGFMMKKHKSKYWFLNLAIADFLSLLTLPPYIISAHKGTWTFGPHMCKLFLFSSSVNMYASIYILIALNIARVLSVAKPMFHLKFISQRVSFWICIMIWLITVLFSLPVFYYAGEVKTGEVTLCSYLGSTTSDTVVVNKRYNVSSENATKDILFSDIYTKLSPYIQQCSSDTCCGGIVIVCNITIAVHVRKSKTVNPRRLYRIVTIIIMVYFITSTPAVIAEIVMFIAVYNMKFIVLFNVLTFMPLIINIAYANSCLNPIIYVLSGHSLPSNLHAAPRDGMLNEILHSMSCNHANLFIEIIHHGLLAHFPNENNLQGKNHVDE